MSRRGAAARALPRLSQLLPFRGPFHGKAKDLALRHLLRSAALIDAWFDMLPPGQQPTARALHEAVKKAVPELAQSIKWGSLVYAIDGLHALAIAVHRTHLHLQVFRGATLAAQFPQLEGNSRGLRFLKLRHREPFDVALVETLARAAVQAVRDDPGPRGS